MNNMSSIALAVCLSFGLVACGGGGGGGNGGGASNAQPIPQDNTPISFLTETANYTDAEKQILASLTEADKHSNQELSREEVEKNATTDNNKFIGLKKTYASYAGVLVNKEEGKEDVKYIIDAKQPVTNETIILNALYLGSVTITELDQNTPNKILVTSDEAVSFTIKDKSISGKTNNNTLNLTFKQTQIQNYNGNIGFKGEVVQNNDKGTYEGVFVGPQAEALIGTLEIKNKLKGAFTADKVQP